MLHALFNGKNILGLFSDIEKCKVCIQGLVNNNFVQEIDIEIKSFIDNSITKSNIPDIFLDEKTTDSSSIEEYTNTNTSESEDKVSDSPNTKEKKIRKKQRMEYNLQILQKQREHIENKKNVYECDLKLYKQFKDNLKEDDNFIIPDMFEDKYELFKELEENDKITFDNFIKLYKYNDHTKSYKNLFIGCDNVNFDLLSSSSESNSEPAKS